MKYKKSSKNNNKKLGIKAQGLPINVVVMMIIGIILFGLGIALFSQFSGKGDDQINKMNQQIQSDIASLECEGENWICSPSNVIKNGDTKTFEMFVVNRGDKNKDFTVELDLVDNVNNGKKGLTKTDCGYILVSYPSINTPIMSGYGAKIPFVVTATGVSKTCSFVTTATLKADGDDVGKTPIIIRVED